MADNEPTTEQGGTQWDDPNRQAVGLDPAWVQGTGGEAGDPNAQVVEETPDQQPATEGENLDAMTKVDLLALAKERNVSPANNDMTKQELIDAIRGQRTG